MVGVFRKIINYFMAKRWASILQDPNQDIPMGEKAAEMLGELGKAEPLAEAMNNKDLSPWVRVKAVEVLGKIGDSKSTEFLTEALKDENSAIRAMAACALAGAKGPKVAEALLEVLTAEDNVIILGDIEKTFDKIITTLDYGELKEIQKKTQAALENEPKKELLNLFTKIMERRNELVAPDAMKLKRPKITKKRPGKQKLKWRVAT